MVTKTKRMADPAPIVKSYDSFSRGLISSYACAAFLLVGWVWLLIKSNGSGKREKSREQDNGAVAFNISVCETRQGYRLLEQAAATRKLELARQERLDETGAQPTRK